MTSRQQEALQRLNSEIRRRAEEHLDREMIDFTEGLGEAFARVEQYNVSGTLSTTAVDALLEIASLTLALSAKLSVDV